MRRDPYRHSDKAAKTLKKRFGAEFQNLSVALLFDEMNVIGNAPTAVRSAFERMRLLLLKLLEEVAEAAYDDARLEVMQFLDDIAADLSDITAQDAAAGIVDTVTHGYDAVTGYVFVNEWKRKEERLIEALTAGGAANARRVLKKGLGLLLLQATQYCDNVTDAARKQAFTDRKVPYVRWVTRKDARVCSDCAPLDGKIFPITEVPPIIHYRCRCIIVPVLSGETP